MKKTVLILLLFINLGFFQTCFSQFFHYSPHVTKAGKGIVNTKADNLGYWNEMIRKGYATANPILPVPKAVYSTSLVTGDGVRTQDSPDIPLTDETNITQSENSIFVSPENEEILLNSNNSTDWNGSSAVLLSGANALYSDNSGQNWSGNLQAAGLVNSGDPATAIGLNGWWYVGKINSGLGQSVAYSTDNGHIWHDVEIITPSGSMDLLDKNHLWTDNSTTSAYKGYLYSAWTNLVKLSPQENQIEVSRSINEGLTWSNPLSISAAVNAGSHNQGVNLQTGPEGEVYAVWAIYDSWPSDEVAYGFSKSIDGGILYTPGVRIINNTKGIRTTGTSKNMRVSSFPCMTVDNSNSTYRGTIYVVWSNMGFPGINTGSDIDVYLIKSDDKGNTWSAPVRVNQDPPGQGKQHFLPWITCDQVNGNLCVIYYDDRNTTSASCETWISYSYDEGESWSDMKVSDVSFTPQPIPGLATGYFGDYLGITSRNRSVSPLWTDNRSGRAMSYVSPINLGPAPNQPCIVFNSYDLTTISDQTSQNMNYGDSLYMDLTLVNIGDQPAGLISAYLSTPSPYVRITDSTGYYGFFQPGESKNLPMGYSLKISDTIPAGNKVRFNVRVESVDTQWMSHFTVQAHAPGLKINGINIIDTLDGNRNSQLDPGETVQVATSLSNMGDFNCLNTAVKISSGSDYLSFIVDSVFLDTLHPGENRNAIFVMKVDNGVCPGSIVDLKLNAVTGRYNVRQTFPESVGGIFEDWESQTFTTFPWNFGGDKQWTIDTIHYSGRYSARSGWIYDNQSTELYMGYTCGSDDSISFFRKVSSEAEYDFLSFYIDDILQDQWSGEMDWQRVAFPVASGTHTFKWIYATDIFQLNGANAAWIDHIMFPPPPLPNVFAGPSDTICAGQGYQLHGIASSADSVRWTTYGDGTFTNDTLLSTVYTAGTNDIITGKAKLRLKGIGTNGCCTSSLQLTIGGIPLAHITIEPTDTLCAGQVFYLAADTMEGVSYLWKPGDFQSREISVDTSLTEGVGSKWFTLQITNKYQCSSMDSVKLTFKNCTGINEKGNSFAGEIYPNPNHGEFTLKLFSPKPEKVNLKMLNSLNIPVFVDTDVFVAGIYKKLFRFPKLAPGEYLLVIGRENGQLCLKVVVAK